MNDYADHNARLSKQDLEKIRAANFETDLANAKVLDNNPELNKALTKVDKTSDRADIINRTQELVDKLEEHKKSNPNLAWHIKGGQYGSALIIETNIPTTPGKALKLAVNTGVEFLEGPPTINSEGKPLFTSKNNTPDDQSLNNSEGRRIRHSKYTDPDLLSKDLEAYVSGKHDSTLRGAPPKELEPKAQLHTTPEAQSTSGIGKAAKKVAGAALKAAAPIGVATTISEIKNEAEQNNGHGVASAAGGEIGALATMRALAKPIAEQAKELGTAIKQIDAKQVEAILSDPRLGGGKGKLLAKGAAALGTLGAAAVGAITGSKGTDAAIGDQLDAKLNPPATGTPSPENKGMEKIFGDKFEKFLSEKHKSEIAGIKEQLGKTANSMHSVDPARNPSMQTVSAGGKQQVAALH